MKLSNNFELEEFTQSQTAIEKGIDNTPSEASIANLIRLCNFVLQPLRNVSGVIKVTSGYRSKELNQAIGGSPNSYHKRGLAVDIQGTAVLNINSIVVSPNMSLVLYVLMLNLRFDKMILEYGTDRNPAWIHIQIAGAGQEPRREIYRKRTGQGYLLLSPEEILKMVGIA